MGKQSINREERSDPGREGTLGGTNKESVTKGNLGISSEVEAPKHTRTRRHHKEGTEEPP